MNPHRIKAARPGHPLETKRLFLFCFLLIITGAAFFSCHTPGEKKAEPDSVPAPAKDSSTPGNTVIEPELKLLNPDSLADKGKNHPDDYYYSFIEKKMKTWMNFMRKHHPGFSIRTFTDKGAAGFSSLHHGKFMPPLNQEDSLHTAFHCYSPDRRFIADIYSQRYFFAEENGMYTVEGGDPESGIELISVEDSTWYLIQYTGSAQSYSEVAWINEHQFIVTGSLSDYTGKDFVVRYNFQVFDIAGNSILYFGDEKQYTVSSSGPDLPDYVSVKFPPVPANR